MNSKAPVDLKNDIQGIWWLLSREDRTKEGEQRIDPLLGADPLGILSYAKTQFAAQFMKRDRTGDISNQLVVARENNTSAIGGYDAYFGSYNVNEETGKVAHTLIGSINPSNIGLTVFRELRVNGDELTIELETTTPEGEPIVRNLIWQRISQKI